MYQNGIFYIIIRGRLCVVASTNPLPFFIFLLSDQRGMALLCPPLAMPVTTMYCKFRIQKKIMCGTYQRHVPTRRFKRTCLHALHSASHQLRSRRVLSMLKYVPLRARRVLSLYKVYGDSTLLVLNGTSLNSDSTLLVLNGTSLNSDSTLLSQPMKCFY